MENYIGKLLDNRYEILEVIGTGGMAVVYKALDHRLNRMVAMKILKDDLSMNQEFRRRFHAESQAVAMLSHPNIVSVFDVSRSGDADYIVMELIEGISLKQYLERKVSLNWRETLHFSMQIAKALEHAHSRGIVHRDIKPHNILILKDGSIKVADFGIARVGATQHTLTREALGSVHYISPEQAKGARVDNRSDLYSLGVVMYEMLTGRTPYDGETPVAVALQHITGEARHPSELMAGIPLGLEQITLHAMTPNADERYMSASDMLRDMEEFRKNPAVTFTFGVPAVTPIDPTTAQAVKTEPAVQSRVAPQRTGMTRTEAERYAAARNAKSGGKSAEERRVELGRKEEAEAEERKKKRLVIAIIVSSVILMVLVGLVIALLAGGGSDRTNEADEDGMPRLVGMAIADIDPNAYEGYIVDIINYAEDYSDIYEEGIVMKQSLKGTTIKLTVSKGPEPRTMPSSENVKGADLQKKLDAMDLNLIITIEDESSSEVQSGFVIRTEPEAGTELNEGDEVVIYVSLGENRMPDLTNDTKTNAEARLNALQLDLKIIYVENSDGKTDKDRVIKTEPEAGSQLDKKDTVVLYISTGEKEMPKLKDTTEAEARSILKKLKLDLQLVFEEEASDSVEKGRVIRTNPTAGSMLSEFDTVTIYLSTGKQAKMPDLRGKTTSDAEAVLKALKLDLKLTFVEEDSDDIEAGKVIRTEPAANSDLSKGDTVHIIVSSGSAKVVMENLYGWSLDEAIAWLYANQINYGIERIYDDYLVEDCVVSQSIAADTKVGKNDYVIIYVSKGPDPAKANDSETSGENP